MKKLVDIIKPEYRFYTVDGVSLSTAQDLFRYISECTPENFAAHVNSQKNDFANWTLGVLKLPVLASKLQDAGTAEMASDVLLDHFKLVDKYVESIDPKKYFVTIDGYDLKDVLDLYYYIVNCDDASYNHHVTHIVDGKNDFVKWISEVLNLKGLPERLEACNTRNDAIKLLSDFLVKEHPLDYSVELESNKFNADESSKTIAKLSKIISDAKTVSDAKIVSDEKIISDAKISSNKNPNNLSDVNKSAEVANVNTNINNTINTNNTVATNISSTNKANTASSINFGNFMNNTTGSNAAEETIDLSHKPSFDEAEIESEHGENSVIKQERFRQFSDEELEKFVSFARQEKTTETNPKVEYLQAALAELRSMIQDLRRAEKDPMVADLMLRTADAKINYYALTKDIADYNKIIRLMKNVQSEIEECATQTTTNLAQEILKDLRLQGIIMKKA